MFGKLPKPILAAVIVFSFLLAQQLNGQQPFRSIASGHVQSVSNGMLTIVVDGPASGLSPGTKMSFVVNGESMIFDGSSGKHISVTDIQGYQRARVQYISKAGDRVAVHIRLFHPVQSATSQAPITRGAPEAKESAGTQSSSAGAQKIMSPHPTVVGRITSGTHVDDKRTNHGIGDVACSSGRLTMVDSMLPMNKVQES